VDVAVTKARNVVYFSGPNRTPDDLPGVPLGTAVTNRTIGFGAQPFFPPGIQNTPPGPFFPLFQFDTANPCTQGAQPVNPNRSGVVFFAGSAPLYKNGRLVGGLGVSGDGVDQDDYVTAGGATGFEAPPGLRADRLSLRGVRLPYLKFPRNPEK
jgi:Haem-degrading